MVAQPLILNDQRQAGAAIEGAIRHEELNIKQLAVDTHGLAADLRAQTWRQGEATTA
jgi:hypothetical protein